MLLKIFLTMSNDIHLEILSTLQVSYVTEYQFWYLKFQWALKLEYLDKGQSGTLNKDLTYSREQVLKFTITNTVETHEDE